MGKYLGATDLYDIALLFAGMKTVAVAGYSPYPELAGHYVPHYLAQSGYEVLVLNARRKGHIDGLPCFPDLASIPQDKQIHVVNVFRSSEFVPQLVEQAARRAYKPALFWMHLGAENLDAAHRCIALGITPVMYACMMATHQLLHSERPELASFAEVVAARYKPHVSVSMGN